MCPAASSPRQPTPPDATVTWVLAVHEGLTRLRVRRDGGPPAWQAGQYIELGVAGGELRRPLSISSPILAADGSGLRELDDPDLELYVRTDDGPFGAAVGSLRPGDRVWLGAVAAGACTLSAVPAEDDVLLLATGTGEAPHNALVEALLRRGQSGRVASLVACRHERDLAYREIHQELVRRYPGYAWHGFASREGPRTGRHLQDLLRDGSLWDIAGIRPDPDRLHVFLCGNPAMVGRPREEEGRRSYPPEPGVAELLERQLGLTPDGPGRRGRVHFELYG